MSETELKNDSNVVLQLNLLGHKKPLTDIAFNPENNQFASSSDDKSIMVWNTNQNSRSYNFFGHDDIVTSIDYSSDGKLLASSSQDRTVRLWVPTIKGGSSDFKAHTSAVRTVSFSPDNTNLITGSNDKSVKLWDVRKRQFISSFLGHNNWVRSAQFSENGQIIASCADDRTVRIWDKKSGECVHVFTSTKGSPTCLSIHNNSNSSVVVAMNSGSLRVYDIRAKRIQQHYVLHDYATGVCWHPSGNYFLSCGKDGKMIIVDVMEGRPLYTFTGHKGEITCVKFNSQGDYLASGGTDRHVMVWKVNL